jgi:hypothetical protein
MNFIELGLGDLRVGDYFPLTAVLAASISLLVFTGSNSVYALPREIERLLGRLEQWYKSL